METLTLVDIILSRYILPVLEYKTPSILIDFEDAFTSYSGVPTALVTDVICLILAGFEVTLWYSDRAKTAIIKSWISEYLREEEQLKVKLLETRPSNLKMWILQLNPWLGKKSDEYDYSVATLFPRLPTKSRFKEILRIHDPYGPDKNFLITFLLTVRQGAGVKNALARTIRTYSYSRIDRNNLILIFNSNENRNLWYSIYKNPKTSDLVIYPTVQFAVQELLDGKCQNLRLELSAPFFIFIGGQRQRKDPLSIIELWAENLDLYDFNLIVVGSIDEEKLSQSVKKARQLNRVKFLKYLSLNEMRVWIEKSIGVVFNSRGEGFGFPIAEGIYLGKPVICNDLEVFKEIGGKYPYFFESGNYEEALEILLAISEDRAGPNEKPPKSFDLKEGVMSWKVLLTQLQKNN
jgi:glycosyltransferase involved in cell wall biosynthesis